MACVEYISKNQSPLLIFRSQINLLSLNNFGRALSIYRCKTTKIILTLSGWQQYVVSKKCIGFRSSFYYSCNRFTNLLDSQVNKLRKREGSHFDSVSCLGYPVYLRQSAISRIVENDSRYVFPRRASLVRPLRPLYRSIHCQLVRPPRNARDLPNAFPWKVHRSHGAEPQKQWDKTNYYHYLCSAAHASRATDVGARNMQITWVGASRATMAGTTPALCVINVTMTMTCSSTLLF